MEADCRLAQPQGTARNERGESTDGRARSGGAQRDQCVDDRSAKKEFGNERELTSSAFTRATAA
jgi:hypothetical protein